MFLCSSPRQLILYTKETADTGRRRLIRPSSLAITSAQEKGRIPTKAVRVARHRTTPTKPDTLSTKELSRCCMMTPQSHTWHLYSSVIGDVMRLLSSRPSCGASYDGAGSHSLAVIGYPYTCRSIVPIQSLPPYFVTRIAQLSQQKGKQPNRYSQLYSVLRSTSTPFTKYYIWIFYLFKNIIQ